MALSRQNSLDFLSCIRRPPSNIAKKLPFYRPLLPLGKRLHWLRSFNPANFDFDGDFDFPFVCRRTCFGCMLKKAGQNFVVRPGLHAQFLVFCSTAARTLLFCCTVEYQMFIAIVEHGRSAVAAASFFFLYFCASQVTTRTWCVLYIKSVLKTTNEVHASEA